MTEIGKMASFFFSIKFFVYKYLPVSKIKMHFFSSFFHELRSFWSVRLFLCHKCLAGNDLRRKWTTQKQIGMAFVQGFCKCLIVNDLGRRAAPARKSLIVNDLGT